MQQQLLTTPVMPAGANVILKLAGVDRALRVVAGLYH
jgi:hypothetical protein